MTKKSIIRLKSNNKKVVLKVNKEAKRTENLIVRSLLTQVHNKVIATQIVKTSKVIILAKKVNTTIKSLIMMGMTMKFQILIK